MELKSLLDLKLAWKRLKKEEKERNFVCLPYESILIDLKLDEWIETCMAVIATNKYNPGQLLSVDVPKPHFHVRAGTYLYPVDKLIYSAFVGACYKEISKALEWSNNKIDFSYSLSKNSNSEYWVGSPYVGWSRFRNISLQKIRDGAKFVFFTDISGYYDNIEINTLCSDLRSIGCEETIISNLSTSLKRWAHVASRGIPQGFNASDILAKLYLNSVDQFLSDSGINFLRYVDDFRIFCDSEKEAKQAIRILTKVLRKKGLSLQTGKSEILPAEEAASKIQGIIPVLQKIEQDFLDEIFGADNPYGTLQQADEIINSDEKELSIFSIVGAYDTYITSVPISDFDKTLFHFLLKRLGKAKNNHAFDHCLKVLRDRPEETDAVLKYVFQIEEYQSAEPSLIQLISDAEMLFP